jgi:hypothetical protein
LVCDAAGATGNVNAQFAINAVRRAGFGTAYGPAVDVPAQLQRLGGPDKTEAMAALQDLWCGLCHQDVQVDSAALRALPFFLDVLTVPMGIRRSGCGTSCWASQSA